MSIAASQSVWRLAAVFVLTLAAASSAMQAFADEAASEPVGADAAGIEFFEQKIRPVLVAHCYKCHAADSKTVQGGLRLDDRQATRTGGDSGAAVVPGKVSDSLLMTAIEYGGEFYDMPPDGKLPANVIADFRKWVEMGAPDPRVARVNPTASASASKAATREDLWVLKPLVRPTVPDVKHPTWSTTAVDRFVLATLEKQGFTPAAPADRYTLLRRVTYDLTGLPPTPAEIEAFVNDDSDAAWERVVDRLLASPAFGDHWARHWFDLSCYADLADVQGNVVVQGAWRYRDYVIGALNADKPFDRFVAEQLAGDLLPYESVAQRREQLIATGYLSIGPWALQNYVKQQLQADVVDHQVDKVSRTFLGMSVRCARCHDHKFDPIPTRDYYALAGIFNSTLTTRYDGPGVWSQVVSRELPPDENDRAAAEFAQTVQQLKERQTSLQTELGQLERETSPVKFTEKVVSPSANTLTQAMPIAANEEGQEYQVAFAAGPTVWAMTSQATGAGDGLLIQVLRKDGSVLAFHEHTPGAWSGATDAQTLRPDAFAYRGDGSGPVTLHITASRPHTGRFAGAIDDLKVVQSADSKVIFSENFDRYETRGTPGQQANTQLPVFAGVSFPGWIGGGTNHSHAVDRSGVSNQHNIALQIFSGPPAISTNPEAAKIQHSLGDIASRLQLMEYARPSRTQALSVQDVANPQDAPIFVRGNFRTPGASAPRGALTAVSTEPFPTIAPGTSGRKELAEWLTSSGNPVAPRVLANRVWQHLFGAGLVRSVDYFGIHGEQPSHPELLDYLAVRFRDDTHWSLKALVRELVLSSAYRMSSAHDARAAQSDPDNRLLWRMNRRRLTAESIRDGMLATSGTLDVGRGGDALGLEIPGNVGGIGDQVNLPTYGGRNPADHIARRRSVYLPLYRSPPDGPLEILSVFDFPHPSEITGQRSERTVATQALFLLNAPLVKEQSQRIVERLFAACPPGEASADESRLNLLYMLVLNRPATEPERLDAIGFMKQFERDRAALPGAPANIEHTAWTEFCHALYASNDFLFLE